MTFRVGMKVVCVDDSDSWRGPTSVRKGIIYTIRALRMAPDGECGVELIEVKSRAPFGFFQDRFRPIVERKTDISVFTEILRKAKIPALIGNERT